MAGLISLPAELLLLLAENLHNIEDYTNLSSTCRTIRSHVTSVNPNALLRLAAAQSRIFFRPDPLLLVAATARQLGDWARLTAVNEAELAQSFQGGVEGVLALALRHCGLTMTRVRELHALRFSIINPVSDIIDRCVGNQWYETPDFWNGGVSDAYTIDSDPTASLFHLAIYGELFATDLNHYIDGLSAEPCRALTVETRLEFIKYCVPDFGCEATQRSARDVRSDGGTIDPRRAVKPVGPYVKDGRAYKTPVINNNIALVWVLNSSRWRPHWERIRGRAGVDFESGFENDWWYIEDPESESVWKQRLWENVMVCQGLEGLGMIRPELQDAWVDRIREWRTKIDGLQQAPGTVKVGRQATYDYPFLFGDLRICASGYVLGT
ncbi:hypothetical protein S40288_11529 [Stachybotrys chartarum IBT 40288]|nr:hypothetical protein S40288_11529 [Stachybotrys chartarum IBT 40288]